MNHEFSAGRRKLKQLMDSGPVKQLLPGGQGQNHPFAARQHDYEAPGRFGTPVYQTGQSGYEPSQMMASYMSVLGDYYARADDGIIVNWFKRWDMASKTATLRSLFDFFEEYSRHWDKLIEFEAKRRATPVVIQARHQELEEEAIHRVLWQQEGMKTYQAQQEYERQKTLLELERLFLENEVLKMKAAQERTRAEREDAEIRLIDLRASLTEKIVNSLDFQNINMKQVYVLVEMVKNARSAAEILTAEQQWEKLKAEVDKERARADQEETDARFKKWKYKETKKTPGDV